MENKIPKTKKECFALLDEMLSEEEKLAVVEKDVWEMHFTLGLWIRNNWLYPQSVEEVEALLKSFGKQQMFCPYDPDDCSGVILEAYQKYLKKALKK